MTDSSSVAFKRKPSAEATLDVLGVESAPCLDGAYEQETIQLQSGDILAIHTDGVTEAVNPSGVEFGEEKLRLILAESLRLAARESAEKIIAKVSERQGQASQRDDITLIVAKVK